MLNCSGAAHIPLYLYPFLNTVSKTRPFEYLRLTSLGVIGALVKVTSYFRKISMLYSCTSENLWCVRWFNVNCEQPTYCFIKKRVNWWWCLLVRFGLSKYCLIDVCSHCPYSSLFSITSILFPEWNSVFHILILRGLKFRVLVVITGRWHWGNQLPSFHGDYSSLSTNYGNGEWTFKDCE